MIMGSALICNDTWRGQDDLHLLHCPEPLKKTELQGLSVAIPPAVQERMDHVSQIGLKNHYLGKVSADHNRWNHSKGVYTLGLIWLHALYNSGAIPNHLCIAPYPDYSTARILLGYCFLLHDYGHLPFSHLLEEALHSISWVPEESGQNSLEYTVLRDRLTSDGKTSADLRAAIVRALPPSAPAAMREDPIRAIIEFTHGWSGLPWLQVLVNSPVDADKIDYLRRDQQFIHEAGFPVQTRLALYSGNHMDGMPWFKEFLCDQFVNHAGLLCLQGRSALAAIDLWRERLLLYDRFYLSPVIRAADRITLEIVQQFLIRAVMSSSFGNRIAGNRAFVTAAEDEAADVRDLGWLVQEESQSTETAVDVVALKYRAVTKLLNRLSIGFGRTDERDWDCFAFMRDQVLNVRSTDQLYRELLEASTKAVESLEGQTVKELFAFAEAFIIGYPIQFHLEHLNVVREITRSFQQQYFADVLIDVHSMPRTLSIPPTPRRTQRARVSRFAQILVPKGPAEKWSSGSRDLEPLTSDKVKSLERPFGRILLLGAPDSNRAKGRYIFDRLLAELRQKGVLYEEVNLQ